MDYKIYPITLALVRRNKWNLLYPPALQYQVNEEVWLPINIWLIKGGGKTVLVDTGLQAEEAMTVRRPQAKNVIGFEEGLRQKGVELKDISLVILTHLHYDHAMHLPLMKNIPIVVQEAEVKFARERHPVFAYAYNDKVQSIIEKTQFHFVRGKTEVYPGIELVLTPGHTGGSQAVVVETSDGKAVLSGSCTIRENYYPPRWLTDLPVITPSNHFDAYQAYDSACMVKQLGNIVLPLHSIEVYTEKVDAMPPFPPSLTAQD